MTAPDPGLTDLIAAALVRSSPNSIDTFDLLPYRRQEAWRVRAREVASVVEQHTNGRIAELESENVRLRAQVASIGDVHPGTCSPVETHPDDREINEAIDESECFADAMFEIAEKYGANVTNNMDRWQDGVFLRHIAEFIEDTETAALKHLRAALEGEQQ